MDYLKQAKEFFADDKYATEVTGVVIDEAEPQRAVCSLNVESKHLNAGGTVMGGVIFTLADFAMGVAANVGQEPTVSMTANIIYTGVCKGKKLIARAICEKNGKKICTYTVYVEDELGTKVAILSGTGFKTV